MPVLFRSTVIQSTRLAAAALWLAAISALISPALAVTTDTADNIAPPASLLEVQLVDALTDEALAQQRIDAYQREVDGRLGWRARADTDADGLAHFDLARKGMEPGIPIILRARPFGSNVYSDPINGPRTFRFEAGKLSIRLVSGATEQVMPETIVHLKQVDEDGRLHWVTRATSDARGVVRLDAEGLGSGVSFVARARSLVTGQWKTSKAMGKPGVYEFVVGNKPVTMVVFDALAGSPMADVRVDAYTVGEEGKRRSVGRANTDDEGAALFDIDGLGLPGGPGEVAFKARVFGNHATSPAVTTPGTYKFPVGTLAVRALSGDTGEPLPDHDVHLREVLDTGKTRWSMRGRTDAKGLVRLTPPGLGSGRSYMAQSRSPISGALWSSEVFTKPGSADFIIGNTPLLVQLVDGVSGAPLPDQRIDAVEILGGDQRAKWVRRATTDKDGVAVFELEGLGDGRVFAVRARVYNGGVVQTPPIDAPGKFPFQVGTSPVTLIDADTGSGMAQRKLVAYRTDASGKRRWYRAGVTDAEGTVRFDLPEVSQATPYVIKAIDPFGDQQHFYSDAIVAQGKVTFPIQSDADREPPAVSIASPAQGVELPIADFEVRGEASDNEALADVSLSVGAIPVAVDLDVSTGAWAAKVAASLLTAGQSLAITATARDEAGNRADTTHIVTVGNVDTIAPELRITSPATDDGVPATGFTVAGTVRDDVSVAALLVSVVVQSGTAAVDPVVDTPAVYDRATDSWSLRILSSQLPADGTIGIRVQARDDAGNSSTASVDNLRVLPVTADVRHLVNRVTFGPSLELLERVNTMGAEAFLAEQLDPAAIDDSDFEAMRDALGAIDDKTKLQVYQLLHAIHSERQLNEVMTVFWDNHFNTNVNASNSGQDNEVAYEKVENDAFRSNALGNFRDLLEISAKSPAMLVYLDTISNVASDPNENYPRELLELHTMGVDGGYSQDDVEEVARAFTGWQLVNGAFSFDPSLHDADEKTVLGVTIPARDPTLGVQDGEDVLDILAVHPSTASFVCTKLTVALVIDTPPDALVDDCKTTFLAAADDADQIAQVLSVVLSAAEFNAPANHGAKVKTPLEVVAGIVRALQGAGNLEDLPGFTRSMGMRLFENPVPTGFPDTGDEWISAGQLVERYKTADRIVFNSPGGNRTSVQPLALAQSNGADTAESVVDLILELTVGEDFTVLERQVAIDVLTDGGITPYTPLVNPQEADARLRAVLGTVMSFPAFQFQ